MKNLIAAFAAVAALAIAPGAQALTHVYDIVLNGAQVVAPVATSASATAHIEYDDVLQQVAYEIILSGLELLDTNNDASDDVTAIHFHVGAAGTNGPHVLNVFGVPREDDGDLTVNLGNNSVMGLWDDSDANATFPPSTTVTAASADLLAGNIYIQIHSGAFPAGEIRGQIVPEPTSMMLLASGAALLLIRRRR